MVQAEGQLLYASRHLRQFTQPVYPAIIPLYHTIQIPAGLPHTAHKKTGPPKWACCYLLGWEYRNKRRYSRSFT